MSVIDINWDFLSITLSYPQAELYEYWADEIGIAWVTKKSPWISQKHAKSPYCEIWNSKFSKGHLGKSDWPIKLR